MHKITVDIRETTVIWTVRACFASSAFRVVPSPTAKAQVETLGGTRHSSARRYSFDDPASTVTIVSDDGPVCLSPVAPTARRSAYQSANTSRVCWMKKVWS